MKLVQAFRTTWHGALRIDVSNHQEDFRAILKGYGFDETMVSPLMTLSGAPLPGHMENMFAIADPALG